MLGNGGQEVHLCRASHVKTFQANGMEKKGMSVAYSWDRENNGVPGAMGTVMADQLKNQDKALYFILGDIRRHQE